MAKKVKRIERSEQVVTPASTAAPLSSRSSEREFNPDYSYVINDLKRIGALAGTFFMVLVVLSFFLR